MKKLVIIPIIILAALFIFTSCKKNENEERKETPQTGNAASGEATETPQTGNAESDEATETPQTGNAESDDDWPETPVSDFTYVHSEELGGVEITAYTGSGSLRVRIPDTIEGAAVVGIGKSVFSKAKIESVYIPNSVTHIGNNAFSNCKGLASVTIPSSVTHIGIRAFEHCAGLTSITIPDGVTQIGDSTFSNCKGLTSVTIPNSVTHIGNNAFIYCRVLTSITIPDSVTHIGHYAFSDCTSLDVATREKIRSINSYALR